MSVTKTEQCYQIWPLKNFVHKILEIYGILSIFRATVWNWYAMQFKSNLKYQFDFA